MNVNVIEDIDLDKAELFADSARGIYIPQFFAETVKREFVNNIDAEDYDILISGPDNEFYWETWEDILDNATINHPELGECYLFQDGDLWIVPK